MKVASTKTKIYLGVFVLSLTVIIALCIIIAGDKVSFFRHSQVYSSRFKNTAGLVAGAPVRMGGVEVGRVTKIQIDPSGDSLAIAATLRIDSPYYSLLRKDASVALDTQGLLGDKFVALTAGSDAEPLEEGQVIETREGDRLSRVVEKSTAIMDTIDSTTKKVDAFAAGLPEAQDMKAMGRDFAESAKALRILLTRISSRESVLSTLDDPESKRMLKNSLANLESASSRMDSITKKIDEGQGTLGALVNDRSLYEDVRSLLGKQDRAKIARRVFIEAGEKEGPVVGR